MEGFKIDHKFAVQITIGKLEFDGNSVESFNLFDHAEIVSLEMLERRLTEFYEKAIKKIKEIKDELKK